MTEKILHVVSARTSVASAALCAISFTLRYGRSSGKRRHTRERLFQRMLRFGEPFGSRLRHVEMILEPDAELAGNHDHRFVGETHAGGERGLLAAHEVRR